MGGTRRLSSEQDSKDDPSGFSMTLERGDRDRDRDLHEQSQSDLSVLSPKGSSRPDRCEPLPLSLSQGVKAPTTAEMTRTPHGKTSSEPSATRLSPTPVTRASIPLTCQSIPPRATASDVPHTDTEGYKDAATSLTDSYGEPVAVIDQNQRRADELVCTEHIRTGAQTASVRQTRVIIGSGSEEIVPLQVRNSEGIRVPGSVVISGRVQSVSGAGTNSTRHRAATHKLSYTHNYRCMYQSQMQSSVFKKPESEGLGFLVKVFNYNTSLPQGPKEVIKK
jgi:hypothetical protein